MRCVFLYLALLLTVSCGKDERASDESEVADIVFSYEQIGYLPYRKAVIASSQGEKASLVLYLHGGTSRGEDNTAQIAEPAVDSIASYLASHRVNSVFVVPQCPSDKFWDSAVCATLKSLIDYHVANGDVDARRIYILGGSMGGTGTWTMISSYPNLFAAAMPVAGNPSRCDAASVAATPVLTVMGEEDRIMDVGVVADFCNRVVLSGGDAVLETETGWTHENTCVWSYVSSRLDWIFGHSR